jgi:hypothetical protein
MRWHCRVEGDATATTGHRFPGAYIDHGDFTATAQRAGYWTQRGFRADSYWIWAVYPRTATQTPILAGLIDPNPAGYDLAQAILHGRSVTLWDARRAAERAIRTVAATRKEVAQ